MQVHQAIDKTKRITGNVDKICRSLESDFKGRYEKAKIEFIGLKRVRSSATQSSVTGKPKVKCGS